MVTKQSRYCQGSNGGITMFFDRAQLTVFDSTWGNFCAQTRCCCEEILNLNEKVMVLTDND